MQLDRSPYQGGSEPEVLTVRFSDSVTAAFENGVMTNPKAAWVNLAKETAKRLDIKMELRENPGGELAAAFLTADDCSALIAAMQPEWKQRIIDGLRYDVWIRCIGGKDDPEFLKELIQEVADEYDLDPEDFDAIVEKNLSALEKNVL